MFFSQSYFIKSPVIRQSVIKLNTNTVEYIGKSDFNKLISIMAKFSNKIYTVVSNTYTENGKKLRNFFIREFPIESIGKCSRAGICYNHYGNFSQ